VVDGDVDYVAIGSSMSYSEDCTNSHKKDSSSADLSVPHDAHIEKVFLHWSGSGHIDNTVAFNDQTVYTDQSFKDQAQNLHAPFFGAYADITHLVSGQGSYTVRDVSWDNSHDYCIPPQLMVPGLWLLCTGTCTPPHPSNSTRAFTFAKTSST
jgi:hypothetical protein